MFREPVAEQADVVAGGGEHGVDAVADAALEMVAPHSVVILEMADHRLDGGATLHLTADDQSPSRWPATENSYRWTKAPVRPRKKPEKPNNTKFLPHRRLTGERGF